MSTLASPENLPNPDGRTADVIDAQDCLMEYGSAMQLGDLAVNAVQDKAHKGTTKPELTYYPDMKLVEAARNDPDKFAALMNEYRWLIHHMANNCFLPDGTREDLRQEAMIGFYTSVRDYNGKESSFETFAYRCISRQLVDAVKKSNRHKHSPLNNSLSLDQPPPRYPGGNITLGDIIPATDRLPEDIVIGNEGYEDLNNFLSTQLTPLELGAITLSSQGGMVRQAESYGVIAKKLGTHEKAIDNAVQRVRKKVSNYLKLND